MRARYYNSQIKRFINQDVLTGSITSSPTLNRYSYVEGNPINLTDPFGLSPSCGKSDFGHGLLNLLGMIPGLGEGFDIANSIWYFKEGNLTEGVLSLLSGLPIVGSIAVGGVKLFKGGEKAFETAEKIHKACRLISNGATFTRACSGFIKSGEEIYKNYIKNGKPLDGNFALQAGSMVLNGVTMFFSGKGFVKDFKSMKLVEKMKNAAKKAVDSVKTDFKTFMNDNRGGVDLSFGKKNGKTQKVLYHYTNEKGMNGIINSKELYPSLKANNPKDARYGDGQYLSDILPDSKEPVQLERQFINVPNKYKYTHYVGIDVNGLDVTLGRGGVYVILNNKTLDLSNRIVSYGKVGGN